MNALAPWLTAAHPPVGLSLLAFGGFGHGIGGGTAGIVIIVALMGARVFMRSRRGGRGPRGRGPWR